MYVHTYACICIYVYIYIYKYVFCCSVAKLFLTLYNPMDFRDQASLSSRVCSNLCLLMMLSNHLVLCHHSILLLLSIFPSIRVFSNELALCIKWPKHWSFSISPSDEYSELISFRIDRSDLLVAEGTQDSSPVPQFKSINSLALTLHYGPTLNRI